MLKTPNKGSPHEWQPLHSSIGSSELHSQMALLKTIVNTINHLLCFFFSFPLGFHIKGQIEANKSNLEYNLNLYFEFYTKIYEPKDHPCTMVHVLKSSNAIRHPNTSIQPPNGLNNRVGKGQPTIINWPPLSKPDSAM